jgi:hypothetical protein
MNATKTRVPKRIPLPALAAIAVVAVLAALLSSPASAHDEAHAGGQAAAHPVTAATAHEMRTMSRHWMSPAQLRFHDQMRKLWEDHVTWTRLAIVTFADGSASFGDTAARLLHNQVDIGNAFKPFYGTRAGNHLTALLHDHITIAVELLQAAKDGDAGAFDDANTRWYANSNDIADFISSLNPATWPRTEMRAMMRTHLDQTLAEASSELTGDYPASVSAYEEIHHHILEMADALSDGIMRQFPSRFHR